MSRDQAEYIVQIVEKIHDLESHKELIQNSKEWKVYDKQGLECYLDEQFMYGVKDMYCANIDAHIERLEKELRPL